MLVAGHEDSNGCINYEGEGRTRVSRGRSHTALGAFPIPGFMLLKKCQGGTGRAQPSQEREPGGCDWKGRTPRACRVGQGWEVKTKGCRAPGRLTPSPHACVLSSPCLFLPAAFVRHILSG